MQHGQGDEDEIRAIAQWRHNDLPLSISFFSVLRDFYLCFLLNLR
jgi:hypothetical protein